MYILLSDVNTIYHLQHIYRVCCLPARYTYMFCRSCTYTNMLASNHITILVNTGTSICYSSLDSLTIENIRQGLKSTPDSFKHPVKNICLGFYSDKYGNLVICISWDFYRFLWFQDSWQDLQRFLKPSAWFQIMSNPLWQAKLYQTYHYVYSHVNLYIAINKQK